MQGSRYNDEDKQIVETIAEAVSLYYGLEHKDIFERTRKREIVIKRQMFMAIAKEFTEDLVALEYIGRYCFEKFQIKAYDHATVIHAVKLIKNLIDTDADFKREYLELKGFVRVMVNSNKVFQDNKSSLIRKLMKATNVIEVNKILTSEEVMDFFELESSTLV